MASRSRVARGTKVAVAVAALHPLSVRRHQPEIMFGVLVVVLCRDGIAGPGFALGQCEIPLIAASRVVSALRLRAGAVR
jgi:hypothetical protein